MHRSFQDMDARTPHPTRCYAAPRHHPGDGAVPGRTNSEPLLAGASRQSFAFWTCFDDSMTTPFIGIICREMKATALRLLMLLLVSSCSAQSMVPSFSAAGSHSLCGSGTSATATRIAFTFAGQARTFVHPGGHRTLLQRAVLPFIAGTHGGDTFFYLTTDDRGSTTGHAAIADDAEAVVEAIRTFRPQRYYYGPFNASPPQPACSLSNMMRRQYKYGDPTIMTWHVWWATWEKVRRCYRFVLEHEATFGFQYTWVVRMRVDLWFFGSLRSACSLHMESGIHIPGGVVGCCFPVLPRDLQRGHTLAPNQYNPVRLTPPHRGLSNTRSHLSCKPFTGTTHITGDTTIFMREPIQGPT